MMGLFLQVEVESSLSLSEFRGRVVLPLKEALKRETIGRVLNDELREEDTPEGIYELSLEVTDQARARQIIEDVLEGIDDRRG